MKTSGGSGGIAAHLISALDGGEWSASFRGWFSPKERARCAFWLEGFMCPRAGLDAVE
jgi:hypothetical protein